MKPKFYIVTCLLAIVGPVYAQLIDRRIIIEKNEYYFIEVDENSQIGTLFTGNVSSPIKEAHAIKIPVGRGISAQTNPLAWDIEGDALFAVNFLDHSLNDRNQSIKKIAIQETKEWAIDKSTDEILLFGFENNIYTLNEPYLFIQEQSIYRDHFYFDIAYYKGALYMAITNNNELTMWRFKDNKWVSNEPIAVETENYFRFFEDDQGLSLLMNEGSIFSVADNLTLSFVKSVLQGIDFSQYILIQDKNENKAYYMNASEIEKNRSLHYLIKEFSVEI